MAVAESARGRGVRSGSGARRNRRRCLKVQSALGDLNSESLQLRAGGDAALGAAGAVAITSGQDYSSAQTGSDVRQSLQTDRSVIDSVGKVIIYGQQAVQLSATTVVSCPSVRNSFFAEYHPCFFKDQPLGAGS